MSDSKNKTSSSTPKTLLDKIVYAIRNQPPGPNGVSRTSIAKYLQSEFDVDKSKSNQLKSAFKKGVEKGTLIQTGQTFRVAKDPMPDVPVEAQIKIEDIKEGSGPEAESGDTVVMKYKGQLDNNSVFDSASSFEFTLGAGEVIKGWDLGIVGMKVGGIRKLFIPSKLGYGKRGALPEIPPNSDLHFTVTLKEIK
jgi:FKBP-type peptidyl-prolyl cis-trans isomerase